MPFRAVLMPRQVDDTTVISDETLEREAERLREVGRTVIRDPDGQRYECVIGDLEVTDKGIEAMLSLDITKRAPLLIDDQGQRWMPLPGNPRAYEVLDKDGKRVAHGSVSQLPRPPPHPGQTHVERLVKLGVTSTMSMGCKVAEPPPCSVCDKE